MLRFQSRPDKVLTEVVTRALQETIDFSRDEDDLDMVMHINDPSLVKAFGSVKFLVDVLEKLLKAHESKKIYMPTDYHFLLLDRILRSWCDCYNDMMAQEKNEKEREKLAVKDGSGDPVYSIDYGTIIEFFFWDTDYDFAPDIAAKLYAPPVRDSVDILKTALNASLRKPVDTEDLAFKEYSEKEAWGSDVESDEGYKWWLPYEDLEEE